MFIDLRLFWKCFALINLVNRIGYTFKIRYTMEIKFQLIKQH